MVDFVEKYRIIAVSVLKLAMLNREETFQFSLLSKNKVLNTK